MELVQKLKDCPVKVAAKVGVNGKLFGSVTTREDLRRPQGAVRLSGGGKSSPATPSRPSAPSRSSASWATRVTGNITVEVWA